MHDRLPPIASDFNNNTAHADDNGRMAPPFTGAPTITSNPLTANELAWEEQPVFTEEEGTEEGIVEPMFAADVSETEAALAALSARNREGEFPLDAFIIPEQAQRLPTGVDTAPPPPEHTPVTDLADRLEKLSHRLRVEESSAVVGRLAGGDKLDAMLAGLLGGYLASM